MAMRFGDFDFALRKADRHIEHDLLPGQRPPGGRHDIFYR